MLQKNKPCVTLVNSDELQIQSDEEKIVRVRFEHEYDELALKRVWEHMAQLKADGELQAVPPPPPGGIRLRGKNTRQSN